MSGGVDSAVSAYLLQRQGYNVIALFMHNWEESEDGCCTAEQDFDDVKRVSDRLGIAYYSVNFAKQYRERVFDYFLEEYRKGRTPNPDVLCNREIKFGPFLDYAKALGADYIATGHYCGVEHVDGVHYLLKAKDASKDQTYFLNQLSQSQLKDVLFPLADVTKAEVRHIAEQNGLSTARKKDSTGICFIGERNFRNFLRNYIPCQSGDIVDIRGNRVGEHIGLMFYTLGQRRGLGLGGDGECDGRWFVVDKDMANNRLIVSHGDESVLMSRGLLASGVNFIPSAPSDKFRCAAKFRYRQSEQEVEVTVLDGGKIKVDFAQPQRAVTPGQFVVLYDDRRCLGGATIDEVYK